MNEMSDDIEARMCLKLQETECGILLDESTVRDNQALLLACARFINDKKFVKRYCSVIYCKHFAKKTISF